jgi:DNA-directed RNA polymerase specialized sigma24 family protein
VDALGGLPPSERELIQAACRGDEVAFGHLVTPYRGELQAHSYRMLGSLQDAEDALQDALLGAWQGLAKFEGRSSLRSWLPNRHPRLPETSPLRSVPY